jgi:hypothetical protein
VTADELRRRVDHDVGAPFDRAAQVRRCERVVDDQRQPVLVRDRRHGLRVQHVAGGVADRLAEERLVATGSDASGLEFCADDLVKGNAKLSGKSELAGPYGLRVAAVVSQLWHANGTNVV